MDVGKGGYYCAAALEPSFRHSHLHKSLKLLLGEVQNNVGKTVNKTYGAVHAKFSTRVWKRPRYDARQFIRSVFPRGLTACRGTNHLVMKKQHST